MLLATVRNKAKSQDTTIYCGLAKRCESCDYIPAKQLSNFMGKLQIRIVYDNIYLNCWDPVKTK